MTAFKRALRSLFGGGRERRAIALNGSEDGGFPIAVVGEAYRMDDLWRAVGAVDDSEKTIRRDLTAVLVPEPNNRYDRNAIAVFISSIHVGYLSREDARRYRKPLDRLAAQGLAGTCAARIKGGRWISKRDRQRAKLGVVLDIAPPGSLLPPDA